MPYVKHYCAWVTLYSLTLDLTLEQWTPGCGNALYWMLTYVVTVPWPSLTLKVWPLSNVHIVAWHLKLIPGCSGAEEYVFTLGFSSFEVHLYLFSLENVPVMFCGCMVNGSVAMVALWVAKGVFPTSITSVISFSLSLSFLWAHKMDRTYMHATSYTSGRVQSPL